MADGVVDDRIQLDANVDDLDPRLWPHVIDRLLGAGADDAWITPIVMKKGRPAFTLSALCLPDRAETLRRVVFTETSTIGLRETTVRRYALERSFDAVDVGGIEIAVKTASSDGDVVNRSVEWDDVERAATALGMSAKEVLAAAIAEARSLGEKPES